MSCLPLNSVPGNDLKLKSVFPRKSDLCSACAQTRAHTRQSLPLHKHNWHCHNSHLPHITQSSGVAARRDPCPSGCVSVWVWAEGKGRGGGREIEMTNFTAEKRIWLHVSWQSRYKSCHQRSDAWICVSARITHISITRINKGDFDGVVVLDTGAHALDTFAYGSRWQTTAEARGRCQSRGWQSCSGYGPPSAYWGVLLMHRYPEHHKSTAFTQSVVWQVHSGKEKKKTISLHNRSTTARWMRWMQRCQFAGYIIIFLCSFAWVLMISTGSWSHGSSMKPVVHEIFSFIFCIRDARAPEKNKISKEGKKTVACAQNISSNDRNLMWCKWYKKCC